MRRPILSIILPALAATQVAHSASVVANAFEFNTPGDKEGWQHNGGVNGGSGATTGPTTITVGGTGEGVLTAQVLPGNGDLRVLHNPDLALDTDAYSNWTTIEVRFRQLDGLNGSPQTLTANSLANLWLGTTGTGSSNITGAAFVEETPNDPEFWYTASLDISGMGSNDIGQIRFDPVDRTDFNYQLDWVRVSAEQIPEPSSSLLALLGGSFFFLRRRRA